MPRRQAIQQAVRWTIGVALAVTCGFGRDAAAETQGLKKGTSPPKRKAPESINPSAVPIKSFIVVDANIRDVIMKLRAESQVSVSFIQAVNSRKISIHVVNGTVQDVLTQLVQQDQNYQWQINNSHLVVFPNETKYQETITPHLALGKRTDVTIAFAAYLKANVRGFESFAGLVIVGEYSSRVFDALIALPESGTVLHLFMELLGNDPLLMLSDYPENNGIYTLGFNITTDFISA